MKQLCANNGLRLHKFVSTSKNVIAAISPEDRSSQLKNLDLRSDPLPLERALGVGWCVESDKFQLPITVQDNPLTRCSILSTVSSVYAPLDFISPVMLRAKLILQEMCRDRVDWDNPVSNPIRCRWEKWRGELYLLNDVRLHRQQACCFDVFAANRVQQIRDETISEQWQYVESKENPVDDASRGLTTREFLSNQCWLCRPHFLWNFNLNLTTNENHSLPDNDREVKANILCTQTASTKPTIAEHLEYFSDWYRGKRAISVILRCPRCVKKLTSHAISNDEHAPPAASNGMLRVDQPCRSPQ